MYFICLNRWLHNYEKKENIITINLSPTFFSIFINDLPKYLSKYNCDPVYINKCPINILMCADDIILLSSSASGLQKSLDKLYRYCSKWNLEVNLNKTKIIIFHKRKNIDVFTYNGNHIVLVDSYKYLGVEFLKSVSFMHACRELTL